MRKWSIFPILIVLACLSFPASAQEHKVVFTLERTPCFGACPTYKVSIYADGSVVYEGERFVDVTGTQTSSIEAGTVQVMLSVFEEAGYFDWNDAYTKQGVTDVPTVISSVTRDGQTKQIVRYEGDDTAPMLLPYLENWIDTAANTQQWTGKAPRGPFIIGAPQPVITLQREPCFGTCAVYQLDIYEDGTVIYTGIDHVQVLGVRSTKIDAQEVSFLADQMELTGYFDWQDEYTTQNITDQAYVTTSLSWDNQSKRIVRYDGDPNAPVGLVRLEDRIDSVAGSDQWV